MSENIRFTTNATQFENDYLDIIKAFAPDILLSDEGKLLSLELNKVNDNFYICKIIDYENHDKCYEKGFNVEQSEDLLEEKRVKKRVSKATLYSYLQEKTQRFMPYGSLTGIRPTKLFHELLRDGVDAKQYLMEQLFLSEAKVSLLELIVANQKDIYNHNDNEVDVFVNIPICVTRCSYCSFISAELGKIKNLVDPYCELLAKEIENTKTIIARNNYIVRSVYVGGGTPTSLNESQLDKVLSCCDFDCKEFTVEAGRPDTITKEKLDIMQKVGVTRISINPQSFNQKTLDIIGRKHSVDDIYEVFKLARTYNFDINMDLIAMLPNESFDDFAYSVDCAVALDPENITIHTLALKRGSELKLDNYDNKNCELATQMVDYSYKKLIKNAYNPYYLYRQKYVSGNLENIGYCKKGKACIYNIDIMEEINTIIANGAGGISKLLSNKENRLERLANPKGIDVYLQRDDENITKKVEFFCKAE